MTIKFLLGMLSRLLGDPIYESYARQAIEALWQSRDNKTGLFGNVILRVVFISYRQRVKPFEES
jgi:hypothetical protein